MKNLVKQKREALGLSQAKLGEDLGVSRQTVNSIEKGRYDPSLTLALKLAKFFSTPVETLFRADKE